VAAGRVAIIRGQRKGRIQGGRMLPGDPGRGVAPSFALARTEPPHPSVAEGAKRAGEAGDPLGTFKKDAALEGYERPFPGHEPKPEPVPGEKPKPEPVPTKEERAAATAALPPELRDIEHMRAAGDLPEGAEARLAAAESEAQAQEAHAAATEALVGCVMRHAAPAAAAVVTRGGGP
jgi:hypothetical protein